MRFMGKLRLWKSKCNFDLGFCPLRYQGYSSFSQTAKNGRTGESRRIPSIVMNNENVCNLPSCRCGNLQHVTQNDWKSLPPKLFYATILFCCIWQKYLLSDAANGGLMMIMSSLNLLVANIHGSANIRCRIQRIASAGAVRVAGLEKDCLAKTEAAGENVTNHLCIYCIALRSHFWLYR